MQEDDMKEDLLHDLFRLRTFKKSFLDFSISRYAPDLSSVADPSVQMDSLASKFDEGSRNNAATDLRNMKLTRNRVEHGDRLSDAEIAIAIFHYTRYLNFLRQDPFSSTLAYQQMRTSTNAIIKQLQTLNDLLPQNVKKDDILRVLGITEQKSRLAPKSESSSKNALLSGDCTTAPHGEGALTDSQQKTALRHPPKICSSGRSDEKTKDSTVRKLHASPVLHTSRCETTHLPAVIEVSSESSSDSLPLSASNWDEGTAEYFRNHHREQIKGARMAIVHADGSERAARFCNWNGNNFRWRCVETLCAKCADNVNFKHASKLNTELRVCWK